MIACLLLSILIGPARPPAALQDLVREAQRLRDRGELVAALKLLDQRLVQAPDDAEAARLRAQTLYWLKDVDRAREAYAGVLTRHPEDRRIRIEFARMLAETGHRGAARALLERPGFARDDPEAATLLGTILYWDGDLAGAKRLFLQALARKPANAGPYEGSDKAGASRGSATAGADEQDPVLREAARQLHEIQMLSASWVKVAPAIWHDDQPLDSAGAQIEAGWFVTPLLSIAARISPRRYSSGVARTFWNGEVEMSHFAPSARIETHLAVGVLRRPVTQQEFDWTGRGSLGLRADGGVLLQGRFERAPYLHTLASLDEPLMTTTLMGLIHWSHGPGWLGEAAVQNQRFPDANSIQSAYGWLFAPIARGRNGELQAGYAFSAGDAGEDRFVLANLQQQVIPSDPRFDFAGIYDPYFTPQRVVTHSAIAAVQLRGGGGPVFRAGGSYGFHAREDATTFAAVGTQVTSSIGRRSFTPWTARASLEIPASPSVNVNLRAETGRTSYYQWTTAAIELVYRFLPHAPGDARSR